jgi:hypothetical protein
VAPWLEVSSLSELYVAQAAVDGSGDVRRCAGATQWGTRCFDSARRQVSSSLRAAMGKSG